MAVAVEVEVEVAVMGGCRLEVEVAVAVEVEAGLRSCVASRSSSVATRAAAAPGLPAER